MRHVVIGGGIAAVQCVEELARLLPEDEIILVSSTRVIKVHNHVLPHIPNCGRFCFTDGHAVCTGIEMGLTQISVQGVVNTIKLSRSVEEFEGK